MYRVWPAKFIINVLVLWSSMVTVHSSPAFSSREEVPKLLVISFDGFRWDYLNIVHRLGKKTPSFDRLIAEGVSVRSPGVKNAFMTKTVPNHYTIVTGLYEENHGIVANDFFDPVYNDSFNIYDQVRVQDSKWWNGTGSHQVVPVWVTNELADSERRASGVYMWPGSNVKGQRPMYFTNFSNEPGFRERADQVVSWFLNEAKPINFGMLYMPEPDYTGHVFGPKSLEVADKLCELDNNLSYLFGMLEKAELMHKLNIIITSDHGMESVKGMINISDVLDLANYKPSGGSPVKHIWPKAGKEDMAFQKLQTLNNTSVFKKGQLPKELRYHHNRRIAPIILIADEGYQLCVNKKCGAHKGDHGYYNTIESMHPIFIARGPAFKKNYVADPFNSVDIYSLLCHLLDINPLPNDGSLHNIKHILADSDNLKPPISNINIFFIGSAAVVSGLVCFVVWRLQICNQLKNLANGSFWLRVQMPFKSRKNESLKPLLQSEEKLAMC